MSENAIYQGRRIFIEVKYVHFADIVYFICGHFSDILCSDFCSLFTEFCCDFVFLLLHPVLLFMLFYRENMNILQ